MAAQSRSHAGIDAYEQHAHARPDAVGQAEMLVIDHNRRIMNFLFKEEPEHYSYDAFAKDKRTTWTGVRNPVAQKHLRAVKKGDRIFYYHTGDEKAIVGIAKAVKNAYADPSGTG